MLFKKEKTGSIGELGMGKIDHLVSLVDATYQEDKRVIEKINQSGLPYLPKKGKRGKGFQVSNIWLGYEYFELLQMKNHVQDNGWSPAWTKAYYDGMRGLICIMIDTNDIEKLINGIINKGIPMTDMARVEYKILGKLTMKSPWRNAYAPFFEGAPLQIGFQQLDAAKLKASFKKKMTPNSDKNGITQIKQIKIYGQWTENDKHLIHHLFPQTSNDAENLVVPLENNGMLIFMPATEYKVEVLLDNGRTTTKIHNIEIS